MTWGYRYKCTDGDVIEREFETKEELIAYLERMDSGTIRDIRYWYIEENFDAREVLYDLVDGDYADVTPEDWLDDALDQIEYEFLEEGLDWKEDTIENIYYRE